MASSELEQWEARLRAALDEVDGALEQKYGSVLTRRPGRPASGTTVNPKYDGLFTLDAKFSLGITTKDGPGYTVDLRSSSVEYVSIELHSDMLNDAAQFLDEALQRAFPERNFAVAVKGNILRITGDMDFA